MEFSEKSPSASNVTSTSSNMDAAADLTSQFAGSALEALQELGVQTFQASALETTVVQQMDEQFEIQSAMRASKDLQTALADLENVNTQISRLKSQCHRLSKQDQADPEVKDLYAHCLAGYRSKKAEKPVLEARVSQLTSAIEARVHKERASRLNGAQKSSTPFEFDLGMRTTTTEEQEALFLDQAAHRSAPSDSSPSLSTLSDSVQLPASTGDDDLATTISRENNAKRRKRHSLPSGGDADIEMAETASKRPLVSVSTMESELDREEHSIATRRRTPASRQQADTEEDGEENPDEEWLDEVQAPKNDDEEAEEDITNLNPAKQRVKRTALGDTGDDLHGTYVERIEKWILEHKEDPRSREIRKLRKWLTVRNKALFRRGELTEAEKHLLAKPMPTRKISVSKNDEIPTVKFDGGFEIPRHLYKKLFEHQRVAVRWLWELHQQEAGGILGDEMGLGKTLETIAFLAGLSHSGLLTGPILIVCPTTVVAHWLREFHWWAPEFSVLTYRGSGETVPISPTLEQCAEIFNQPNGFTSLYDDVWKDISASLSVDAPKRPSPPARAGPNRRRKSSAFRLEDAFGAEAHSDGEDADVDVIGNAHSPRESVEAPGNPVEVDAESILDEVLGQHRNCERPKMDEADLEEFDRVEQRTPVVLIVSYETVRMNIAAISRVHWHYAIMDEGHKLRNPEAAVTQACKRLPTPHRMLLTGTPIQNNLVELWSLFDFCFPGKLGTLETFQTHFAWPIQRGGYANASPMEARVAYKCALTLRDLVNPYLLRRSKDQVNIQLPEKSEQILFCQLTEPQREAYKAFLRSADAKAVYEGLRNMLYGVDILRKICNHTFLNETDHGAQKLEAASSMQELTEGSAKLKVLNHILALWRRQGHRVLIFTQTIQMLNIVERFVEFTDYPYLRMDGQTQIGQRQKLVDKFNEADPTDPDCPFLFLLTTRVGGLGINLTSANRVIVYDPDWNPMTDLQAKERAYRIGQTSSVIVYRLVTTGTIEEKIYHRQVFKQFLTQKILRDPKQTRSFFQSSGLRELFKLSEKPGPALHEDALTQVPREEAAKDDSSDSEGETGAGGPGGRSASAAEQQERRAARKRNKGGGDGWLLNGLMGQGIAAQVDHDVVINNATGHSRSGSARITEAYVEQEAENLAAKAVDMLRRSRSTATALGSVSASAKVSGSSMPKFGTISRTASNTSASAASSSFRPNGGREAKVSGLGITVNKTGLSGAELVQSLKENSVHPLVETQAQLVQLKDFFLKLGGSASSQQIADWFRDKVPQRQLLLFRSLLRKVADFDGGSKYWTLRPWAGGPNAETGNELT